MANKKPREFTTPEGRAVEITGARDRCQAWIDGQPVLGLQHYKSIRSARIAALDYSRRHAGDASKGAAS